MSSHDNCHTHYSQGKKESQGKQEPVRWMAYNGREPYTYDRAVDFCQNHGLKLCSRAQYCDGGHGGVLLSAAGYMAHGDNWAPVNDSDNSWIRTGDGGGHYYKQCWTHSELGHGKPKWGTTGLKDGAGGLGRGLCCSGSADYNATTASSHLGAFG